METIDRAMLARAIDVAAYHHHDRPRAQSAARKAIGQYQFRSDYPEDDWYGGSAPGLTRDQGNRMIFAFVRGTITGGCANFGTPEHRPAPMTKCARCLKYQDEARALRERVLTALERGERVPAGAGATRVPAITPRPAEHRATPSGRQCANPSCGKPITGKASAKYCSDACRVNVWRRKREA